jgi:putative transposase
MPRARRICPPDVVFHVINRANDRRRLFFQDDDYQEFLDLLNRAMERVPMRTCAFCLMPNHWHLVLWPTTDGDTSTFVHWLSSVHAMRVRRHSKTIGEGHVYQDRFRSFPVETGVYYWNVVRYVEANALRAGLVERAEDWRWSSLVDRTSGTPRIPLAHPMELPPAWQDRVNEDVSQHELIALRESAEAGRPYGSTAWASAHTCRRQRARADTAPYVV